MSALLEAWLTAFLALAGLSAGAVSVLAIGHLLRESWLAPVRAPLEAMAGAIPVVALMALPVLAWPDSLYPWAGTAPPASPPARAAWLSPWPFRLRGALILACWCGAAWWMARRQRPPRRHAAAVLALMLTSVILAAQDWSLSRGAIGWGGLQGIAVWTEGMMASLALAALTSLARGTMPGGATDAGEALKRGLLALGLAALWLWFTQFITVWMADLPPEAGWYLRRGREGWGWLMLGVAVPALLAGLALAAPPRHRPWRLAAVCALLLVAHLANLWWVVRPDAPIARPPIWLEALVASVMAGVWASCMLRHPAARAALRGQPPGAS